MELNTRIFGEAHISDDKILTFPKGIIGFPDLKRFALMYDKDKGSHNIQWLQSIDEPSFAMPVIDPLHVDEHYDPLIDDDVLEDVKPIGSDNLLILVTITVPHDLTKMTANLRGPFIINTDNRNAVQVIVDDDRYEVKQPVYEILKKMKEANEGKI
ncbi:flagellar assembly protein FliW [Butyrivibrio sp. MC2013]|uniref:flagellar assembly protein FliW n=1 Tax=Butyrivibrio sp. MC2013 TaxID=1280686 RepID=UPI000406CAE0|nr:flagellar assembly protein FliW [Butyrivibrio sp. MC2013]